VGSNGNYWSSTLDGTNAKNLNFNSSNANTNSNNRAFGFSVRCLKDCNILQVSAAALVFLILILQIMLYAKPQSHNCFIIYLCFCNCPKGIKGIFSGLTHQQFKLIGFKSFNTYSIDSTQANEKGEYQLFFGKEDYGMAYLLSENDKSFVVILSGESIKLKGESLAIPESIDIIEGNENKLFEQYASEHPRRDQTLSAWDYLTKIYRKDSLFAIHQTPKQAIEKEKQRI
jgi:hypothetical protein